MLNEKNIKEKLNFPIDVRIFDVIDSTNTEARRQVQKGVENGKNPILFLAKEQSAGRGRMGRSFLSRNNSGIYMSFLYYTDEMLGDAISITTYASVIVSLALEKVTGRKMRIKWVNDIYNDEGKVCGILTEAINANGKNSIIVGIGINVGDIDFPEKLRNIASTVGDIGGRANELIAEIVNGLYDATKSIGNFEYMSEYRKRLMYVGESVELFSAGESVGCGKVVDVDDIGGLVLINEKNEKFTVRSGEISLRRK